MEDVIGLRLAAGLHYLHLTSTEQKLEELYEGRVKKQEENNRAVADVISEHDESRLSWFDKKSQTNEVGRSARILKGLAWVNANAEADNPNFEILEVGSNRALNLLMPHHLSTFGVDNGNESWDWGAKESRAHIKPVLRGPLPPRPGPFRIISAKGCDLHPVNLSNLDEALHVQAFVWVDMDWLLKFLKEATKKACKHPPSVVREDAGAWVKALFSQPQKQGIRYVLVHSIVWQYLDAGTRHTISEATVATAKRATSDRPLAWLSLETNRKTLSHELSVRLWPGDSSSAAKTACIAEAHAHGAWIKIHLFLDPMEIQLLVSLP